jgi:hypothetical protein
VSTGLLATSMMEAAEKALACAISSPIEECPALLQAAAEMVIHLSQKCTGAPFAGSVEERQDLAARLLVLKARLDILKRGLDRSHTLIEDFARRSGMISQEYSPRGLRAPAA